MAPSRKRSILQRQLDAREKLWPSVPAEALWSMNNEGWVAMPRLMPLIMSIMDDLSGKGFPVSRAYLEIWSRMRIEESFITLNRSDEMAFHAGFEGQRASRTWKDRIKRLKDLEFIDTKNGPLGEFSYAIIYNPYHVIKKHYLKGSVNENKWQSLVIRSNEVSCFDLEDIGDDGNLIIEEPPQEQKTRSTAVRKKTFKSLKQIS